MTIDVWGLGLQAINVLILVWLLSRLFWRPVAAAIARRQDTANAVIATAEATQARADAALAEAMQARAGIASERSATLDDARTEAEARARAILTEARDEAEAMMNAATTAMERDAEIARKANAARASELSLKIAARLLERMNGPAAQSAFLSQLITAIEQMPAADRAALADGANGLEVVTPGNTDADHEKIEKAIQTALGGTPKLRFVTDPGLIAGIELRSPHFVLHNSWQADLAQIRKAVTDGQ